MHLRLKATIASQPVVSLYLPSDDSRADRQIAKEVADLFKPFGIYCYMHPGYRGTDMFGFILSPRKLTKQEVDSTRSINNGLPQGCTGVAFEANGYGDIESLQEACKFFNLQTLTEGPLVEMIPLAASREPITPEDVAKAFYGTDYQYKITEEGMNSDGSFND